MKRNAWVRSAAVLILLAIAVTGINIVFTAHAIRSNNQQRCASFLSYASIPLPKPVPGINARSWEADFERIAAARARQLGCTP